MENRILTDFGIIMKKIPLIDAPGDRISLPQLSLLCLSEINTLVAIPCYAMPSYK